MNEPRKDGQPGEPGLPPSGHPGSGTEAGRRRTARAIGMFAGVSLSGVTLLGGLAIWHLSRRARLIRERASPVKDARWPELPDVADS